MMMENSEIIAAFCTALAKSAISVMRISGDGAGKFADKFFYFYKDLDSRVQNSRGESCKDKKLPNKRSLVEHMKGYRAAYGYILDPSTGEKIDDAVLTRFVKPHSYTGEEMVEISIHGSIASQRALMELVLKLGARAATAGEFTRRAFLNGKMDLLQAEAVLELINSEGQKSREAALDRLDGKLSERFIELRNKLYFILSELEVSIAYPEYEENDVDVDLLRISLEDIRNSFYKLASGYRQSRLIDEGIKVAILGAPNAGKSSLLNALLGYDRAIVSNIAGTTRDTVESKIEIDGIILNMIDTAGLRQSDDYVEKIGIERSIKAAKEADLILWLIEATKDKDTLKDELKQIEEYRNEITGDIYFFISKTDLDIKNNLGQQVYSHCKEIYGKDKVISFSNLEEAGVDRVLEFLRNYCQNLSNEARQSSLISNQRQYQILVNINNMLDKLIEDVILLPLDISSQAIKFVVEELARLTGEEVSETLLDEIFSNFCVGK